MSRRNPPRVSPMCAVTITIPERVLKLYVAAAARRRPSTASTERRRVMRPEELMGDVLCNAALRGSLWESSLYNRQIDTGAEDEAEQEALLS